MARLQTRLKSLLKYADLTQIGIEIAPYFNPALPKRNGHDVRILDVFDTDTLRQRAAQDPFIEKKRIDEIEDVDFVGDACRIGDVVKKVEMEGQFAFIISSHNFEHLSNPIEFLRGCHAALSAGGVLSMAIPDYRACFDHFRVPTQLAQWLQAYHEDRRMPSPETIFDSCANRSLYRRGETRVTGCNLATSNPDNFVLEVDLNQQYRDYLARLQHHDTYTDAHCSVLIPEIFEFLLRDLNYLGLVDLEILEIMPTQGHEFFVHLRKPEAPQPKDEALFYARRSELAHAISYRVGATPFGTRPRWEVAEAPRPSFLRMLFQPTRLKAEIRELNRRRIARRRRKTA